MAKTVIDLAKEYRTAIEAGSAKRVRALLRKGVKAHPLDILGALLRKQSSLIPLQFDILLRDRLQFSPCAWFASPRCLRIPELGLSSKRFFPFPHFQLSPAGILFFDACDKISLPVRAASLPPTCVLRARMPRRTGS